MERLKVMKRIRNVGGKHRLERLEGKERTQRERLEKNGPERLTVGRIEQSRKVRRK